MKLKSSTTTKHTSRGFAGGRASISAGRRLPRRRPPTHPGEMLLEEFLKPLGISQSAFAVQLGISFPRINDTWSILANLIKMVRIVFVGRMIFGERSYLSFQG